MLKGWLKYRFEKRANNYIFLKRTSASEALLFQLQANDNLESKSEPLSVHYHTYELSAGNPSLDHHDVLSSSCMPPCPQPLPVIHKNLG